MGWHGSNLKRVQSALRVNEAAETTAKQDLKEARAVEKKAKSDAARARAVEKKAKSDAASTEARIKKLQTQRVVKQAAVEKARKALDKFLLQKKRNKFEGGELPTAMSDLCAPVLSNSFHPLRYSSGKLRYAEDDASGGMEIDLEARVRMQGYVLFKEGGSGDKEVLQLVGDAAAGAGDGEGGAPVMKKRKTSKTENKPLLSSVAQFHKLRQEVQRSGKCIPATTESVKKAVLKSLNFGDHACLENILFGSHEYHACLENMPGSLELLSNPAPNADALGLQGNLNAEDDSLHKLKKELTQTLGLPERAADFVARQKARGCAELAVWLLSDKKKPQGDKIRGTSVRKVLIYGVGPSAGPSAISSSSRSSSSNATGSANRQHQGD